MSHIGTVPKNHNFGGVSDRISRVPRLDELVRGRVLALYGRVSRGGEKWTAEKLAPFLGISDPSGVRKLLNGNNKISLAHIEGFCTAFQVSAAELVAEPGSLIQPVTPIESALLTHFRQMTELERRSLLTILERPIYAAPDRKARMGRAMPTVKEQELVDLYARVKKDGVREGVLKTLRGAAEADERPTPRRMTE